MKYSLTILSALIVAVAFAQPVNNIIQKGNEAYRQGKFDDAVKYYKNALRKDPANNTAWYNLANALQRQSNFKEAQKDYDQVIAKTGVNSLKAESNYNKGLAYVKEKNLLGAISSFKESLRGNPSDEDARENLQLAINELKKQQQQNQPQNKNQQQQNPKQNKQPPINKDMMQQKFNELRNQEKQLQQKLQNKNSVVQPDKDW